MQWFLYALLSALFAALATILAKIGLRGLDPVVASTLRAVVMALLMLGFMLVVKNSSLPSGLGFRSVLFILLSGIAGAASWILYFYALKIGEASRVAVVDRASVLFVLVMATILLGEKITLYKIIAAILIFAGLVLITM